MCVRIPPCTNSPRRDRASVRFPEPAIDPPPEPLALTAQKPGCMIAILRAAPDPGRPGCDVCQPESHRLCGTFVFRGQNVVTRTLTRYRQAMRVARCRQPAVPGRNAPSSVARNGRTTCNATLPCRDTDVHGWIANPRFSDNAT